MLIVKDNTKGNGTDRSNLLIRVAAIVVAMAVALSISVVSTYADDSGVNSKPTLKQLRDKYNEAGTPPLGEATFATPVNTSEYTPATLTNASLTFAQKYINYMRYQAGVGEIALDSTVNANAAQGALILARLNTGLSHSPAVPSGVSATAAAPGQYATAASNLSYSSSSPYPDYMSIIEDAISGQMRDDSGKNLNSVGHRRWLIKPSTSTMGIGSALIVNRGGWNTAYTDVRIMNRNSNPPHNSSYGTIQNNNSTDYDFVAWPASGFMLNETFNSNTPWSIHIHESKYQQIPDTAQIQITRADGKVWTINSSAPNTLANSRINSNYFKISNNSNSGFTGEGHTLIFCPNPNELGSGKLRDDFNVKITGLKSSSGASKTIEYTVKFRGLKPNLDEMSISLESTSLEYTGQALKPTATVNYDGTTLTEGTDYQITYSNNTNVTNGGATATITGKGAYEGSVQMTFSITPKKISVPSAKTGLTYTGQPQNGVDTSDYYTVADGIKTDAGSYTAKLTLNDPTNTMWADGTTGQKTVSWSIAQKSITSGMVTISPTSMEYNGSNQKPTVTVKDGNKTLTSNTDYTPTNNGGTNVGNYNVIVDGKGNYQGRVQKTFVITAKKVSIPIAISGLTYNGQSQQGIPSSIYYSVTNGSGTNAGTYTASLTLTDTTNTTWADGTTGQKSVSWSISKKSLAANMIELAPAEFTYNGNVQKPSQVVVRDNDINKLLEQDDYTLTNNGGTNAGTYSVTVTGKGNYQGTQSKSFEIKKKNLSDSNVIVTTNSESISYTGASITPGVSVKIDGLQLSTSKDYSAKYENNINVGTARVTVTAKDNSNYTGSNSTTFQITPKQITASMFTLEPAEYDYQGSQIEPGVRYSGLTSNDYTKSYGQNLNVGQGWVRFAGKGNYTGSVTKYFTIKKAQNRITSFTVKGGQIGGSELYYWDVKSSFGAKQAVIYFSNSANGSYTTDEPTKAGTYYAKACIPKTANYTEVWSSPVPFEILPQSVSTPPTTSNGTPTGKVTILNTIANSAKRTNDVIWDKSKVKGASKYEISWRKRGASKWNTKIVGNTVRGTTTGLTIKGLYEIRVRPSSASGKIGAYSNTVYRYFHTTEKIRLASRSKGTFTMSWQKNPEVTGYQVLYTTNKNGTGAAQNIKSVGASATSITVKDIKVNGKTQKLRSGMTYYVQVREIRKVGGINYIGNISVPVAVKVK